MAIYTEIIIKQQRNLSQENDLCLHTSVDYRTVFMELLTT